jgi:hypothetical protein
VDPHRLAEARSIAYHGVIGQRLVADPGVVQAARDRIAAWRDQTAVAEPYLAAWESWLSLAPESLAAKLVETGEHANALRQVSPFAGVLSARERWRLHREIRAIVEAG